MKKRIDSDFSFYMRLNGLARQELTQLEIYKACIIEAINGGRNSVEGHLSDLQKQLLEVRRMINAGRLDEAGRSIRLLTLEFESPQAAPDSDMALLRGDLNFINGLVLTSKGDHKSAANKMNQAALLYNRSNDSRRALKALVNEHVCIRNSLSSYETGPLLALKTSCLHNEFYDVAANVLRSHSLELLIHGSIPRAIHCAHEAQAFYRMDGYPDDHMTAKSIEAIGHALLNNFEESKKIYLELNAGQQNGKNKTQLYLDVLKDLLFGKLPNPSLKHPLSRVPWKTLVTKAGSLKGKLIEILRAGPRTRDALINEIWGSNVTHSSYNQRLHSLLSEIRDGELHFIHFDGEIYRLI